MSNQRVVIDPITRIEGHLRIDVEIDAGGNVVKALSADTQVGGMEIILKGRDPHDAWAFAQRICRVCTLVHGLASVRAVEDALGIEVPENGELIHDLLAGAQLLRDSVIHGYHLQSLDWVNPIHAFAADPKAVSATAATIGYRETSVDYFAEAQARLKDLVESGQLGIFANGWWDHPVDRLPPEVSLIALTHYLEALAWQHEIGELPTIFGGKNPHPNVAVGGAPCAISGEGKLSGGAAATAVSLPPALAFASTIEVVELPGIGNKCVFSQVLERLHCRHQRRWLRVGIICRGGRDLSGRLRRGRCLRGVLTEERTFFATGKRGRKDDRKGRVPGRGVGALGKSPAEATATSLA